jgi:hypothetical protein
MYARKLRYKYIAFVVKVFLTITIEILSCEMRGYAVYYMDTNVYGAHVASIFRSEDRDYYESNQQDTTM